MEKVHIVSVHHKMPNLAILQSHVLAMQTMPYRFSIVNNGGFESTQPVYEKLVEYGLVHDVFISKKRSHPGALNDYFSHYELDGTDGKIIIMDSDVFPTTNSFLAQISKEVDDRTTTGVLRYEGRYNRGLPKEQIHAVILFATWESLLMEAFRSVQDGFERYMRWDTGDIVTITCNRIVRKKNENHRVLMTDVPIVHPCSTTVMKFNPEHRDSMSARTSRILNEFASRKNARDLFDKMGLHVPTSYDDWQSTSPNVKSRPGDSIDKSYDWAKL